MFNNSPKCMIVEFFNQVLPDTCALGGGNAEALHLTGMHTGMDAKLQFEG
jgi:hypothetical protein